MAAPIFEEHIDIPVAEDGSSIDAYLARPEGEGRYPAVIVGMELFGVNEHLCDVTRRVARLGYVAIAPNFYHRTLPKASLPFGEAGRAQGFEHLNALQRDTALHDVRAVLGFLHRNDHVAGPTGFLGFSMGGHIAYLAATQFDIAASAVFYGGWLANTDIALSRPEPTLALTAGIARHGGKLVYFAGGKDHAVTAEQRAQIAEALKAAHVRHELVVYPEAQHGFFCELRETFDEAARDDAWARVQALLKQELAASEAP